MTAAEKRGADRNPGSFRDPYGFIVEVDGRIIRCITTAGTGPFDRVRESGFLDKLVDEGRLVPFSLLANEGKDYPPPHGHLVERVVEHPRLPFISYPYEWCFSALKDAALLHLDLLRDGIAAGVSMRDASAYNVQFVGGKPVFIDHLSFTPYVEGEYWGGHEQFCAQFLNPLLLESAAGVAPSAWYRGSISGLRSADVYRLLPWTYRIRPGILLNVGLPQRLARWQSSKGAAEIVARRPLSKDALLGMIGQLRRLTSGLALEDSRTAWSDYTVERGYSSTALDAKAEFVRKIISERKPTILWDIGCNTGEFAELSIRAGAGMVIGFDSDRGAIEKAYRMSRLRQLNFLPLYMDLLNPTPSLGWREKERASISGRRNADFVLALALVHHLVFHGNLPLWDVIDSITNLAPEGIIEFIPKDDPMVQELVALRGDLFPAYNDDELRSAISARARIKSEIQIPGSRRTLFHFSSLPQV
jgi:ribosomal protein L11 methylase PrmA